MTIDLNVTGAAALARTAGTMTPTVPGAGGTFTASPATGYPSSGKFAVVVERGLPTEETILINSLSGTTFTVGQRGYDGTSGADHPANATVELDLTATIVQALINHENGTDPNPHAGILLNNAAHDVIARHFYGTPGAFGPGTALPTVIQPDASQLAGVGTTPARADHTHGIVAAAASQITGALAEGASTSFARADHNHTIGGTNHIPAAALVNKSVAAAQITDAIIAEASSLLAANNHIVLVQAAAPGSPQAGMIWVNTTKESVLLRDPTNTNWLVILTYGAGFNYTPTLTNLSVGGGYNIARYRRIGRNIIADGYVQFGAGATTNANPFGIGLPAAAVDTSAAFAGQQFYFHAAARGVDNPGVTWAGVGVIASGGLLPPAPGNNRTTISFFATGGTSAWNNTIPFTWDGGAADSFSWFCEYEAASAIDANFT